jgi:hypothetical protein
MTLSELMLAVRQRADMVPNGYTPALTGNNFFVTEPELISYINQSYFELYDLMISCYGANYFVKAPPYTFATDGTTSQYPLPADFYKLLGLDLQLGNSNQSLVTIKPFEFIDRNRYAVPNFQSFYGVTNLRYRLNGNSLWLTPTPAQGQTIQAWYVPRLVTLATLTDTADGISGWTEYIITDAAIKCMQKEESDTSILQGQKAALITRIQAMADSRDIGSPHKVSDSLQNDIFPMGNGAGYSGGGW